MLPDAAVRQHSRRSRGGHGFEVTFGDLSKHVLASSHDVLLFGERLVLADEVALPRYMQRARPDLDGSWSRSWLDVILSPTPFARRRPVIRPLIADASSSTTMLGTATTDGHAVTVSLMPDTGEPIAINHGSEPWITTFTTIPLNAPAQHLTLRADSDCVLAFVGYEAA